MPTPTGTETFKDNQVYWEGYLRFIQSNWQLAKTDPNNKDLKDALENNRDFLRTSYINRGKNVGGDRLRDEYAQLKAEMLPGWDETRTAAVTTRPAATAPAASTAK